MTADELIDVTEVAELAGVAPATIHRYKHLGQLPEPTRYAGRSPMWRRKDIERWLASRPGQGAKGRPKVRRSSGI